MLSYQEWSQGPQYNRAVNGKEFEPQNLEQAGKQLMWFSSMLMNNFGNDPRFGDLVKKSIQQLQQTAKSLVSDPQLRQLGRE